MSQRSNEFDDPMLKQAVRQAFEGERASDALRMRLRNTISQAASVVRSAQAHTDLSTPADHSKESWSAPATIPVPRGVSSQSPSRPTWLQYAVAALVLLSIGAGIQYWLLHEPAQLAYDVTGTGTYVYALPLNYQEGMAAAHARPMPGMLTERTEAQTSLTREIAHKTIAPEIPGWRFSSAEAVQVADRPAARMVYTRGAEMISVFSMIAESSYPPPDGTNYDEIAGDVAFAGVVKQGMIYCVISTSTTTETADALKAIRDAFAKTL